MQEFSPEVEITNRRASHEYYLEKKFEAGIRLVGTEVKSIRNGGVNMVDSFCSFEKGELYIHKMNIAEYKFGNNQNHLTTRTRKLLLKKRELRLLAKRVKERGYSIIPTRIYINERGLVKVEIALARGKKVHDKRDSIKKKDQQRDLDRSFK